MKIHIHPAWPALAVLLAWTPAPASDPKPRMPGLEGGAPGLTPRTDEHKDEQKEVATLPLQQRLGDLAAEHMKVIVQDAERRVSGYPEESKLVEAGKWYMNDHALALQALGETAKFNALRDKGAFYHGDAPSACLELIESSTSVSGHEPSAFRLKRDATPCAALDSLRHGLVLLDCGTTTVIAYYEALRAALGDEKFDAIFAAQATTPLLVDFFKPHLKNPLQLLVRAVPEEAPYRRGQIAGFAGLACYALKHLNGEGANLNTICDDATPGKEAFIGLGCPSTDFQGLNKHFIDDFNATPIGWDIFPEELATRIKGTMDPSALQRAERLRGRQISQSELTGGMAPECHLRLEFFWERVDLLRKAVSPAKARQLMALWHAQKFPPQAPAN